MNGVTWDKRKPGDWLASNGRWFPQSSYPRGWDTLALPPAPGHGSAASTQSWLLEKAAAAGNAAVVSAGSAGWKAEREAARPSNSPPPPANSSTTSTQGTGSTAPRKSSPRPSTTRDPQTGRRVADATATKVSTYKKRISAGERPTAALPPSLPPDEEWRDSDVPAPPGRVDNAPPPPIVRNKSKRIVAQPTQPTDFAGDLGRVLGKARKRVEEAINEASKG